MKHYAVGFMFSTLLDRVLLCENDHKQSGKRLLTGIGGHIDDYDLNPVNALVREFQEETSIITKPAMWREFSMIHSAEFQCHFFSATSDKLFDVRQTEWDCKPVLYNLLSRPIFDPRLFPNCNWLIPMALDKEFTYSRTIY